MNEWQHGGTECWKRQLRCLLHLHFSIDRPRLYSSISDALNNIYYLNINENTKFDYFCLKKNALYSFVETVKHEIEKGSRCITIEWVV